MGTAVNIEVCPSNMKSFAFLAIVLVSASAIHIPEKYAHYKPGYMRIPDWEKIMSGEKKLNQKEPTMTFEPRNDYLPRADCGIPGPTYNQIGIVSFGSAAGCEIGAPAGFTEVSKYIDWISSVTGMKL